MGETSPTDVSADDGGAVNITPEAVEIDAAHKVLRDAVGTKQEAVAREYLRLVVAKVKARTR